mmetsp:Transcript_15198/g.37902  ORF Transcript_15198/g.37902 Transcript_15198/m.37902 type:complete len:88 (-) Transcript_15198:183-446(-)
MRTHASASALASGAPASINVAMHVVPLQEYDLRAEPRTLTTQSCKPNADCNHFRSQCVFTRPIAVRKTDRSEPQDIPKDPDAVSAVP